MKLKDFGLTEECCRCVHDEAVDEKVLAFSRSYPRVPQPPALEGVGQVTGALLLLRWGFNLGRCLKFKEASEKDVDDVYYQVCDAMKIPEELKSCMAKQMSAGLAKGRQRAGVLRRVVQAVEWFGKNAGSIPAPAWCVRGGSTWCRLWLAVLLLGFGGRRFSFARTAMAREFGLDTNSIVRSFVDSCVNVGFLRKTIKGSKYGGSVPTGRPDEFEIVDESDRWLAINLKLNNGRSNAGFFKAWKNHIDNNLPELNSAELLKEHQKEVHLLN